MISVDTAKVHNGPSTFYGPNAEMNSSNEASFSETKANQFEYDRNEKGNKDHPR